MRLTVLEMRSRQAARYAILKLNTQNDDTSSFYYETSAGNITQRTFEKITPYGTEILTVVKGKALSTDKSEPLAYVIEKQMKRAQSNFPYLKDISEAEVRELYSLPQAKIQMTHKWKKELEKGVTATLTNLKKYR